MLGQLLGTHEEGQRGEHCGLTAVVLPGEDGRRTDGDVADILEGPESTRSEAVQVHRSLPLRSLTPGRQHSDQRLAPDIDLGIRHPRRIILCLTRMAS